MAFFKRKSKTKQLQQRVEALENELGLFYVVDSDDYATHYADKHGYGTLNKLDDRIKDLEKKGKK